jgi:hypothetical protein
LLGNGPQRARYEARLALRCRGRPRRTRQGARSSITPRPALSLDRALTFDPPRPSILVLNTTLRTGVEFPIRQR